MLPLGGNGSSFSMPHTATVEDTIEDDDHVEAHYHDRISLDQLSEDPNQLRIPSIAMILLGV